MTRAQPILFRCTAHPQHENDLRHEAGELRCGVCNSRVLDLRETKKGGGAGEGAP